MNVQNWEKKKSIKKIQLSREEKKQSSKSWGDFGNIGILVVSMNNPSHGNDGIKIKAKPWEGCSYRSNSCFKRFLWNREGPDPGYQRHGVLEAQSSYIPAIPSLAPS